MNDRIYAPFTPEQVRNLNVYQRSGMFHPFTCGNRSDHPEDEIDKGCLVATIHGWICPICWDGTKEDMQDWAVPFMASWASKEEMETSAGYKSITKIVPIQVSEKLKWLHSFCKNNKSLLAKAFYFKCFYCLVENAPILEIKEWADEGKTAICPYCGVDAILPVKVPAFTDSEEEYTVSRRDMCQMKGYWFNV